MITYETVEAARESHKTFPTNQAVCESLGIDTASLLGNPEFAGWADVAPFMEGLVTGLTIAQNKGQKTCDPADMTNHDEFLASLPENYEGLRVVD